jgi:hypothetical protein
MHSNMEGLIVVNEFHNGDLFYSRIFLNMIEGKFKIKLYHDCRQPLFCDLPNVEEVVGNFRGHHQPPTWNPEPDFSKYPPICTWIGQENMKYYFSVNHGCSYENHFALCKSLAQKLGIEVEDDMNKYIPYVNYDLLPNIDSIKSKMAEFQKHYSKIVLISNGIVNSAQSVNFDFTPILKTLAVLKPHVLFLTTEECGQINPNVVCTSTITEVIPDLLQISYISTLCDVIIGRASGPFCFCHNKDNMLNPNKTFISFSNNIYEGVFYQNQKSKYFWTNNSDQTSILSFIHNTNSI